MPRTNSRRPTSRWKSPSSAPKTVKGIVQAELRRTAGDESERLIVSRGDDIRLQLFRGERQLLGGLWQVGIRKDGAELFPVGPWEENCWHSDQDVDYLELELPLDEGYRLQRQMLLAREGQFLWLADAVLAPPRAAGVNPQHPKPRLDYSSWLPLAADISFQPAEETHEGVLKYKKKVQATVLPVAFPEWRAEQFAGELSVSENQLQLKQTVQGDNLYAPLFIDLDPDRVKKPVTWRRLTVAENLHSVPRDVAAGFRVQAGKDQWVFYQALAGHGNRTVLSHNTAYEFCALRFSPKGKLQTLLEIE